jgi:hypothetical protein
MKKHHEKFFQAVFYHAGFIQLFDLYFFALNH